MRHQSWLQLLDYFTLAPIRDTMLDLSTLSREQRHLALGGYVTLLLIGISGLVWGLLHAALPKVIYPAPGDVTRELSILSIIVCSLGFAVGWGYILVGAVRRHLGVFLALFALFALNTLWMRTASISELMPTRLLGAVPMLAAVGALLWWGRERLAESMPRFIGLVAGVILLWLAAFWFSGDAANRALHLQNIFGWIYFAALPLWVLTGAALINFSTSFAQRVTLYLRDRLQPEILRRLSLLVFLLHPPLTLGVGLPFFLLYFTSDPTFQIIGNWFADDLVATLLLALVALVIWARKQWTTRTAALFLSLRLTLFLFILALQLLVIGDVNVAELGTATVVDSLGVVPPEIFFITTLLLGVLGFFIPLAQEESPRFPQTLRLHLTFGAAILVFGMMFFFFSARDVQTGEDLVSGVLLPGLSTLGLYYGGFLYVLYLVWRHKEEFLGDLDAWEEVATEEKVGEEKVGEGEAATDTPPASSQMRRGLPLVVLLLPLWAVLCSCCLLAATGPFRAQ